MIYGDFNYGELKSLIESAAKSHGLRPMWAKWRGTIVAGCMAADKNIPIIINPAAFTHYSYAIHDAAELVKAPLIEVHLSNQCRAVSPHR